MPEILKTNKLLGAYKGTKKKMGGGKEGRNCFPVFYDRLKCIKTAVLSCREEKEQQLWYMLLSHSPVSFLDLHKASQMLSSLLCLHFAQEEYLLFLEKLIVPSISGLCHTSSV